VQIETFRIAEPGTTLAAVFGTQEPPLASAPILRIARTIDKT
jgi:hypothetical protein